MKNQPSLRQLRHLVSLARHRHFGRAAKACHVTQSTLSASIKELEDLLQATLVDRTRRRVVVTPLGQTVVERAEEILRLTDELVEAAQGSREPLSGSLRLGVIPTVGPFLLPRCLPALRRRFPKLRLYLSEDLTERLLEQLRRGELDLALIALPYEAPDAESAELVEDPFSLVVPRDHPWAGLDRVDPDRLAQANLLLLRDGHCLREHALAACRLADRGQIDAFGATSLYTLVQMVENGLGATLLPKLAIDAGILRGTRLAVLPLGVEAPSRRVALLWRRGTARRGEFELLARSLREILAKGAGRHREAPGDSAMSAARQR
jgi:LysR family hydrogen peroxide-inducible transcriptional activator